MKSLTTKIVLISLIGISVISCGQIDVPNNSDNNQYQGVDRITVYQNDPSDSIPIDKIVYDVAWGNTPDSSKPKFDVNFCKDNFGIPYYFPAVEQLKDKALQSKIKVENKHLEPALQTIYSMTYDKDGKISKYAISGPSTMYSCEISYDNKNRVQEISESNKKVIISYNDFNNIENITEINSTNETGRSLNFSYTYVAFPRH